MKRKQTLLLAVMVGALTLVAGKAPAFPLYLTSFSGTLSTTAYYGDYGTNYLNQTSNRFQTVAFNLKRVMTVVSNQVYVQYTNVVPADARIAFDPYQFTTYLTNSSGYYRNLAAANIARMRLEEIATGFKGTADRGTEKDRIVASFYVRGYGPDGGYYRYELYGRGKLNYSASASQGKMSITAAGSDYGEYRSSDDGVSTAKITFKGAGTPEWDGPYSIFWWND